MVDDSRQHVHGRAERADRHRVEHWSRLGETIAKVARAYERLEPVVGDQQVGGEENDERHHDPEVGKQVSEFRPLGMR